jgi:uncharacterized protein YggU (UPF0235/DUF167 family)
VGRHGEALKVRVTAPPVDGRANDAAARLLAGALGIPAARVVLMSGAQSRLKRFRVSGLSVSAVTVRLETALGVAGESSGGDGATGV